MPLHIRQTPLDAVGLEGQPFVVESEGMAALQTSGSGDPAYRL